MTQWLELSIHVPYEFVEIAEATAAHPGRERHAYHIFDFSGIDGDALFALTGLPLQPIFSLCKILWLKDQVPDAFAATTTWLNTADYIAYRLSGVAATDYSLASRTLALDIGQRQWATHLLNELKIPPSLRTSGGSSTIASSSFLETCL